MGLSGMWFERVSRQRRKRPMQHFVGVLIYWFHGGYFGDGVDLALDDAPL